MLVSGMFTPDPSSINESHIRSLASVDGSLPEGWALKFELINEYFASGRYDEALEIAEQCKASARLDGVVETYESLICQERIGDIYEAVDKRTTALEHYRRALKSLSATPTELLEINLATRLSTKIGVIYFAQNDSIRAMNTLLSAASLPENSAAEGLSEHRIALQNLATISYTLGQYPRAEKALLDVLKYKSGDLESIENKQLLAKLYAACGKNAAALALLEACEKDLLAAPGGAAEELLASCQLDLADIHGYEDSMGPLPQLFEAYEFFTRKHGPDSAELMLCESALALGYVAYDHLSSAVEIVSDERWQRLLEQPNISTDILRMVHHRFAQVLQTHIAALDRFGERLGGFAEISKNQLEQILFDGQIYSEKAAISPGGKDEWLSVFELHDNLSRRKERVIKECEKHYLQAVELCTVHNALHPAGLKIYEDLRDFYTDFGTRDQVQHCTDMMSRIADANRANWL